MAVTPTGIVSEPLRLATELVSGSTTFQTWVGAANQAAAQLKVYAVARASGGIKPYSRPFCLVSLPENFHWAPEMGTFATGIGFSFIFEADTPEEYRSDDLHQDAAYSFSNVLGGIIEDMINYSPSVEHAFENTFDLAMIQRSNAKDEANEINEDYFQAIVRVVLGFSGGR